MHPVLLKYLPDITMEELMTIDSRMGNHTDEQITQFCMIYRSKRKDPQLILILCLLGLFGVAGIHRFFIGHIGMGILYFFTAGLCFVGTIIDALSYKRLSFEINSKMIAETMMVLKIGY